MLMTLASIREAPSEKEIQQAFRTYTDWQLHYYQLLYFHNPRLTTPGHPASPFEIAYSPAHMGCLEVKCYQHPEYDFFVRSINIKEKGQKEEDNRVLHFCEIIQQAIKDKKEKPFAKSCCGLAEIRNCVCTNSSYCEIHGTVCVGTHD